MTLAETPGPPLLQKNCSACGTAFSCGAQTPEKTCWCADLPPVGPIAGAAKDCLCPNCLANAILQVAERQPAKENSVSMVEGVDFYWEGSAMVFTAAYLLRRGTCCDSGCRHCPYDE